MANPDADDALTAADPGLLHAVLALMPDAAVVVGDAGRIEGCNEKAEALFGYERDELVGSLVEALLPERFRGSHAAHREKYSAAPRSRPMGAGLQLFGERKDGTEFPVDISLAPLTAGESRLAVAAIRDVTDRLEATAAQARLAALVQSSDDAIVSITLDGTITSWNPGAVRVFGYSEDEVVGRMTTDVFVPEDRRDELAAAIERVRAGERVPPFDTLRRGKDGRLVDVAVTVSAVRDDRGRLVGYSGLLRDVSERKAAERELRALMETQHYQQRWLEATAEIRLAILSGAGLEQALSLVAARARVLADGDDAVVVLPAAQPGVLVVRVAEGDDVADLVGTAFPAGSSIAGRVLETGEAVVTADILQEPGAWTEAVDGRQLGPSAQVPLVAEGAVVGTLVITRRSGRDTFGPKELDTICAFAEQAALALEIARAREAREQLVLMGERDRIARDLHDLVIQRLFATGITLQGTARRIADPLAAERVGHAVDELDATIRDIRTAIFSLETANQASAGLRGKISDVTGRAAETLGFKPVVRFSGAIEATVPENVAQHLLAVLQEALSNVARHAHATQVGIDVEVDKDDLVLQVTDNGRGLGSPSRSSGLSNMRERAEELGGSFHVDTPPGGGTSVHWRVPVDGGS